MFCRRLSCIKLLSNSSSNSVVNRKSYIFVLCIRGISLQRTQLFNAIMDTEDLNTSISNTNSNIVTVTEGEAVVKALGKVFYNPVQEFNRDLSVSVLTEFAKIYQKRTNSSTNKKNTTEDESIIENSLKKGEKYENGLYILEALSATGLRSIRYAKEVPGVKQILANDLNKKAVESIRNNVSFNSVEHLVTASQNDATMLMYAHKQTDKFSCIDLDPYGSPAIFLDSAVQAVERGGLLLVTATDMAVLAGNSPETCYVKYGSVSLRIKSCHEMAIRILLQCIESHANRYGRYIEPLLSISADFYIRVFVRVHDGVYRCKFTTSKLSTVYHCSACGSFTLFPLGINKLVSPNSNNVKFSLPTCPPVSSHCSQCQHPIRVGGPIWSAPINQPDFIQKILENMSVHLKTYKRIEGILRMILEELHDVPLYYTMEKLCGTLHIESPSMVALRSAFLNAKYRVSLTHAHRNSIKTDAPTNIVWDIMRAWANIHPPSTKRLETDAVARNILHNIKSVNTSQEYSFIAHPDANPLTRKKGYVRFQANPVPFWGPGTKDTVMTSLLDQTSKRERNQNKKERKKFKVDAEISNGNNTEIKLQND